MPVLVSVRPLAKASTPRIEVISSTRALVSRGDVDCERSWDSLAWRHGWEEIWMLAGRDMMDEKRRGEAAVSYSYLCHAACAYHVQLDSR